MLVRAAPFVCLAPSRRSYFLFPPNSRCSCWLTLRWHSAHWQVVMLHLNWPGFWGSRARMCCQLAVMAIGDEEGDEADGH
jgi:hypothetical protein